MNEIIAKNDIVICKGFEKITGVVTRVSKQHKWADVFWCGKHKKRMNIDVLVKVS